MHCELLRGAEGVSSLTFLLRPLEGVTNRVALAGGVSGAWRGVLKALLFYRQIIRSRPSVRRRSTALSVVK